MFNYQARPHVSINKLPIILALYYTVVVNLPIAHELWRIMLAMDSYKLGFVLSLPVFFCAAFHVIFQLFNWPYFSKPFFIFLLLTSSLVSYTMYNYGIFVDYGMIENVFETNSGEAASYLSTYSVIWFVLMGVIPACILAITKFDYPGLKSFFGWKLGGIAISLVVIGAIAGLYYKDYASVGRNNHHLKKMIIPNEYVWGTYNYVRDTYFVDPAPYKEIGTDAKQTAEAKQAAKPTLLVFVLGETARAYNYQYHGYDKPTNQHTAPDNPIFFQNVTSCGTATAVSVPCMFSNMNRTNYDKETAYNQDNVVDIMQRAGIHSIWRDHDGGDKGVAHHIKKLTQMPTDADPLCNNDHCYDTAMLEDFAEDAKGLTQDSIIFYHISGSHGPTYFKRYPESHRAFTPDCQRADIENCTNEALVNTYDNTILYTDYFIAQAIENLKSVSDKYNVGLIYLSDHGESLGENGVYLHGIPYAIAPKEQTHVPMLMWFSDDFKQQKQLNEDCLRQNAKEGTYSHDNLFDSLLGIMDVETDAYRQDQDVFATCRA
ncbi:predicted membrane-associated metal-dependent hydrolase [Photobacterium aphoticum]|uniref:Predicted membrane-associated metal-dependent hydrolase n=1 Tax=Photobacterium aphoticum TaxID=754436 RepID=A0A090R9J6_9GAMM|nr:predicted membrane-associated metal-dependent hydrolase [Photobacterium aphoticum]